jgi:hypothetical protein
VHALWLWACASGLQRGVIGTALVRQAAWCRLTSPSKIIACICSKTSSLESFMGDAVETRLIWQSASCQYSYRSSARHPSMTTCRSLLVCKTWYCFWASETRSLAHVFVSKCGRRSLCRLRGLSAEHTSNATTRRTVQIDAQLLRCTGRANEYSTFVECE